MTASDVQAAGAEQVPRVPDSRFVLGIAGSPRRDGNSDRMLEAALEGAAAQGLTPVTLVVAGAGIGWCRACQACSKDGRCVQRDGMQDVYPLLDAAAAFVVATPVHFASVPAVLKALLDRCQPYWARRYVLGEPAPAVKRPAGLLVASGGGDPYGTDCVDPPVRSALAVVGARVEETVVADAVDARDDILGRPEILDACRALGGTIARRADASI